jgi:hypothetical protein
MNHRSNKTAHNSSVVRSIYDLRRTNLMGPAVVPCRIYVAAVVSFGTAPNSLQVASADEGARTHRTEDTTATAPFICVSLSSISKGFRQRYLSSFVEDHSSQEQDIALCLSCARIYVDAVVSFGSILYFFFFNFQKLSFLFFFYSSSSQRNSFLL